ncbi:MAG: argininosuccinate lyase, partial [Acidobacteriota bacterium]
IMPQKRNPDAPELVRGKTSHVYGYLVSLLSLTKNVVMSYNRDFQEDREPLFNTVETTLDSVRIQAAVWRTATFDADRFEADLDGDFSLATELADYLVNHDVPFREAHEIVGSIVRWCEQRGENLKALTPEVGAEFHASLGEDLSEVLDPRAAADRRTSRGGTAWPEIERQVGLLRGLLDG